MSFITGETQRMQQQMNLHYLSMTTNATRAALGLPRVQPNGGRSSGRPAIEGAAWATVPCVPDAGYLVSTNLLSANPPPGSRVQFAPSSFRPGNNNPSLYGVVDGERDLRLNGICVMEVPTSAKIVFGEGHGATGGQELGTLRGWDSTTANDHALFLPRTLGL